MQPESDCQEYLKQTFCLSKRVLPVPYFISSKFAENTFRYAKLQKTFDPAKDNPKRW